MRSRESRILHTEVAGGFIPVSDRKISSLCDLDQDPTSRVSL